MVDDSDKQEAPKLPPKLNLRKQGILKRAPTSVATPAQKPEPEPETVPGSAPEAAAETDTPVVKQDTSRLVVRPAAAESAEEPADKAEPAPIPAATEAAAEEARPSIKLKPLKPATAQADTPEAREEAPAKSDTKRKTSRIPLEAAKAPDEDAKTEGVATLKPKTIKIKPSAPVPKMRSTQPLSITVPITEDDSSKLATDAAKRKTSRIPLEEALTADKEPDEPAEPADPARPKTIKIRRPGSETATVKAKKPSSAAKAKQADDSEMSKTSRLDLPPDAADATPTQKKTIRVKRPDGGGAAKPAAKSHPAQGVVPPEPVGPIRSDEPGAVWAILAVAASLVIGVLIYVLAAQAVGPNISLTGLSSWTDGPNLSWPGKIAN
ncbi:MAG: hypothetical protein QGH42_12485 [Kiritimatiellia bacterium]|jgi:hypothetical protein|nr:hypothetical protein [Kiritimatiellia bacterium]MDP6809952.1 hypothetical protein [Kiritimatiellia bacterium]MDP7025042.1 hypothetical protein [Kiritimatiellia bacterium]